MTEETRLAGNDATAVRRILVVDDDPDINRLLRARLSVRGYQVEAAADGEEALVAVQDFQPDLIFLDVAMPGVGGMEVLERVRSEGLDLAVIMTTAFGSEEVAIEALRRGADDYLRKPFEAREFQAVLDRTVARLQLSRQNIALRRQIEEQHRQLEAELARAAEVQTELLPQMVPELQGFELAARCLPAREVGGDFYDWQVTAPGLLTLTLGDAMGKGMPAALLMATVRAALRAVSRQNAPAATLELTARALENDMSRAASFMTIFHARLNLDVHRLYYVDGGHGHVFVRRASGAIETLQPGGLPLGMFPDQSYQSGTLSLQRGDALVVYSDGLVEAEGAVMVDRTELADRLGAATTAEAMVDRLIAPAAQAGPLTDDLTAMVLLCTADTP